MINVNFNNHIVKIPSNPDEINLEKGLNIHSAWFNQEHNKETKIEVLNLLKPLQLWNSLTEESLDNIIDNLNFINDDKMEIIYYPSFKLNKKNYGLHKFKYLTVKEYMDLEFYLSYDKDPLLYLDKICSILYRPIKIKNNFVKNILFNIIRGLLFKNLKPLLFKSYEIESYIDKHRKNSNLFKEQFTYSMGISTLIQYNLYKEQLKEEFPVLFKTENKEEDPFAEQEKEYLKTHKIGPGFEEKWGMYHIFIQLVPDLSERILWETKDIKEFLKYLVYTNKVTQIKNQDG